MIIGKLDDDGWKIKIEFVRGRLHFEQRNDQGSFVSKGAGQHDSMVVVFQGKE